MINEDIETVPALLATPQPFPELPAPSVGIVYCLRNAAMPGYVKIGFTISDLETRMRQLDTTGVPLPFECVYALEVNEPRTKEQLLHKVFDRTRVRASREFFEIGQQHVEAAMRLMGGKDVTPYGDVVVDEESRQALDKARKRKSNFNFDMVGIKPGTVLHFSRDETITCTVTGSRAVMFDGQELSISQAALQAFRRVAAVDTYYHRPDASGVTGPLYWELDGESMSDRRLRMEEGGEAEQ